ncbi:hypothetical protein CB1_001331010 [Camelus ferus]|nr:hypothetical protein CB1_001331010 [Camelus ferus]
MCTMAGLMKECQSVPVAGRLTWGRGEGLENRAVGPPHCTSSRSCCCELGGSADPLSSRAAWSQLCIAMSAGPGQGLVGDEMQAWNPPEFNRDSPVGSSGSRTELETKKEKSSQWKGDKKHQRQRRKGPERGFFRQATWADGSLT